ncbi:sulfite exporter TauE/SafE family protein [Pseudokineococcus lusitanus]|uniref:Probable membrane transporter protein n=1 Tax=Pseudokineococcus lusitanus TaxID=763993 RepID=A0A3N1HQ99_9ACTN|nr:sulfite exporter TauE/SafE family protein [Pseudokineococcus lusitanus]ROP44693.1 hypothetical protein EDC03_0819 [Pseudokineococcus lusitanus]
MGSVVLVLPLALVVGLSLGLLGGGGSILAVPLLTYVAGMEPHEAVASSLVVVGVTSAVAALSHARRGNVRWGTGLLFGAAGMAGAFAGGVIGSRIPGAVLMVAFAVMMLATAAAMLRGRRARSGAGEGAHERKVARVVLDGLAVGLVTGLVGAGGGFLVVPALVLLGGLGMPAAVGTSLLVIAMKSAGGLAGYLTGVSLDWTLVGAVTAVAVVGSLLGARLVPLVPEAALRRGFGVFVLVMGLVVLVQELPATAGAVLVGAAALVALAVVVCRHPAVPCPVRRRPVGPAAAAAA